MSSGNSVELRVGVVGLSVGHAIAHLLAQEGLCGRLRLADFDDLELSNLNRVPATVFDLGLNKATVAARRIAELDPYLPVELFDRGITTESVDRFLDGVDVLVEECDSLDTKVLIRQVARARRHPGADGHRRPRHAGRRTIRPGARSPDSARTARRPGVRGARRVAERGEGPLRTADDGRRTTVAADGRIPRRGRNHPGHLATTGRRGRCERRAGGRGRQANRPR